MKSLYFRDKLERQWANSNFVCVGLDSEYDSIPEAAQRGGNETAVDVANTIVAFNRAIVGETIDIACAYKPNIAFYEKQGDAGINALFRTMQDIRILTHDVPVILDAKRADIGNTNMGYVSAAFDFLRADAITVNPYLGGETLKPFLDRADKGVIVLCKTSNPGAGEFQDDEIIMNFQQLADLVGDADEANALNGKFGWSNAGGGYRMPVYQKVALRVSRHWNKNGNCALVVGATYPHELSEIRELVGDMPILLPGIGTQGGDVRQTVQAGKDSRGQGMIINSSRGIIFASNGEDFAQAARRETEKLRDLINQYR